jgi:hypothetical protein
MRDKAAEVMTKKIIKFGIIQQAVLGTQPSVAAKENDRPLLDRRLSDWLRVLFCAVEVQSPS